MSIYTMRSKWGVELDAEPYDLANLTNKINGSVQTIDDLFVSKLNELHVLRSCRWDTSVAHQDVINIANDDVFLIRGCIDLLDGCAAVEIGTVFEFGEQDEILKQNRTTQMKLRVVKDPKEWASPQSYKSLFSQAELSDQLRKVLSDLKAHADWHDIYINHLKH